jgi:hypothetical protein
LAAMKPDKKPEEVQEVEIVRPERAKLSPEEALKRMEEFGQQRKGKLIATVRKGKS